MIRTKRIAILLLIAIATIGAIGIGIGIGTQSVQGQNEAGGNSCTPRPHHDPDDSGNGQSFHDCNGDFHSAHP